MHVGGREPRRTLARESSRFRESSGSQLRFFGKVSIIFVAHFLRGSFFVKVGFNHLVSCCFWLVDHCFFRCLFIGERLKVEPQVITFLGDQLGQAS